MDEKRRPEEFLHGFWAKELARQMFDPPYEEPIRVAGQPILRIPESDTKFKDFLDWWLKAGKLKPDDPQGFRTLSGPGAAWRGIEAISDEDWDALPESERELIRSWTDCLPVGMFYD